MSSFHSSPSPNPVIEITDAGIVGPPLSSCDADAVRNASHAAPFGRGEGTLVDETIRKTWEINATNISIRNPQWDQWIQGRMLPMCMEKMAIPFAFRPYIRAEMYKLLLYEEGAHFKPHRDSEKASGMFATLAVCLPSEHEGVQLLIEHGDERYVWDSSMTSLADVLFAVW